jgi:hypothetical protein
LALESSWDVKFFFGLSFAPMDWRILVLPELLITPPTAPAPFL